MLCCILLLPQPNFPTRTYKVSSYLFMTTEGSVSICTFIYVDAFSLSVAIFTLEEICSIYRSESPQSSSGASGNPQVSPYRRETQWNQPSFQSANPPTFLLLLHPLKRDWKAGVTGLAFCFNCMSSLFFFSSSFLQPPLLPPFFFFVLLLWGSSEGRYEHVSTWWSKKTKRKRLEQTNVASMFFFLFIESFSISYWVYRNWHCDRMSLYKSK